MKRMKKGFSLVELIVSLLVVGVILSFATVFFFTGENLFSNTVKASDSKAVGDGVLSFLTDSVRYSYDLQVLPSDKLSSSKFEKTIYSDSGHIALKSSDEDNKDVFGDDFFSDYTVSYSVIVLNSDNIEINVRVVDKKGEEKYSTSQAVKLINLNVNKKAVEIDQSLLGTETDNAVLSFNTEKREEIPRG